MASKRRLSVSDIAPLFEGRDRVRNTKYFHTMLTNPETPRENLELVDQYRMQHPEQFLSNEEIEANPNLFSKRSPNRFRSKAYVNPYSGEEYDRYGNPVGGFRDGGRDYRYSGYRSSGYRPRSTFTPNRKNDPTQVLSPSKVNKLMFGLKSDYARTRYLQKVCENPQSNGQTIDNIMRFRELHPDMFVDENLANSMAVEKARSPRNYRPKNNYFGRGQGFRVSARDYDRDSWSEAWMSKDDYDSLPQNKKSLFTRFFVSRDRNRNSKLALRILADPQSSQEDVSAVRDIVNERPKLFFKNPKPIQAPPAPPAKPKTTRKSKTTKKN